MGRFCRSSRTRARRLCQERSLFVRHRRVSQGSASPRSRPSSRLSHFPARSELWRGCKVEGSTGTNPQAATSRLFRLEYPSVPARNRREAAEKKKKKKKKGKKSETLPPGARRCFSKASKEKFTKSLQLVSSCVQSAHAELAEMPLEELLSPLQTLLQTSPSLQVSLRTWLQARDQARVNHVAAST